VGELRFRKGQDANVHRLDVAGGGPFFTARCRDRSTHFIPQESSAGRNLITVFRHVNNPEQFFFGPASGSSDADRADRRPRFASPPPPLHQRHHSHFRKAHKKRHFVLHAYARRDRGLAATRADQSATDACERPLGASQGADDRQADLASHKSICAKTAQTFSGHRDLYIRRDDAVCRSCIAHAAASLARLASRSREHRAVHAGVPEVVRASAVRPPCDASAAPFADGASLRARVQSRPRNDDAGAGPASSYFGCRGVVA
jgi:hypothetical protein